MENPRHEKERHFYEPDHSKLMALGHVPSLDMDRQLQEMLRDLLAHQGRIETRKDSLLPDIHWSGERRPVKRTGSA